MRRLSLAGRQLLLSPAMNGQAGGNVRLMIVAGEASGDAHAASLVRALRREGEPGVSFEFFGATGSEMRAAGVESIVATDDLSITGLLEIGGALKQFWRAYQTLKRAGIERAPDAVILVDWPDFNLRLARFFHRRGLRVIYYISPQLWAWREHRTRNIRRDVDLLLAILPFEPPWYAARGITHVEFTGHPLMGAVRARYDRAEFCRRHELDNALPLVALLPGSRHKELLRILPHMIEAAKKIHESQPGAQFVVALAPQRSTAEAQAIVNAALGADHAKLSQRIRITRQETREALGAADAAAVASGTATLEAALLQTPLVVVYKESFINWHTLGRLINTEHFGLVNLVAGERLAPELMQNDFTGDALAAELLKLLDPVRNTATRARLRAATHGLGAGGASERAAQTILRVIDEWKKQS
ncbi:MAG TPA: lipid-A-disaccharide synthase [Pyrinomonadaceae bacterium]|nr:lipid-A-disaccharide synthase [Pyrinomonadaceae bacterium]